MSNNLLLIEDSIDEIVHSVLYVLENNADQKEKLQEEILQLKTLLKNATKAKIEKKLHDTIKKLHTYFLDVFSLLSKQKNINSDNKHEEALRKLKAEQKEIIRLCIHHLIGIITKRGELQQKHHEALLKLWKQYKQISQTIRQIKGMIQNMEHFYSKDYGFVISEIFYFSAFLFGIYLCFFMLLEISLTKSLILPSDFAWKIVGSPFIISLIFFLFITMFVSEFLAPAIRKKPLLLLLSYSLGIFSSFLVFYNF